MKLRRFLSALAFVALIFGLVACGEQEVVVQFDPVNPVIYLEAGSEEGNGSEEKPYGDILDAIAKAKELGLAGAEHITLKFGAGDYSLTETLTLSSEAFGGASLEMICEDEEMAVVGAWLPVTGFTETEVNGVKAWVADMPMLNGELVYSHQFFNGDYERLERPRYPEAEDGQLRVEFCTDSERNKHDPKDQTNTPNGLATDAFYFFEGDIPENLTNIEDIQMRMYHWWTSEMLSVKNINYDTNLMEFQDRTWMNFVDNNHQGGPYFLDNVFENLNDPGEVYEDRTTGKLYYIPYEDESIDSFKIFASTVDTIFIIDGMNGSEAKNSLTIKNIGFEGSDWKDVNLFDYQAAQNVKGSIQILNSSYITFEDCSFDHIGNYAVDVRTYVHHVTFDNCSVSDIGAGGFRISCDNKNIYPVTDEVPHHITITDCTIDGYGKIHGAAVGIHLQYAYDCVIAHNEIANGVYSAMSVGWTWDYGAHATSNITVEKNHIHDIGVGLLSDMGGIYTLGEQPGTENSGNLIYNIGSAKDGYGGWGIYNDAATSYVTVENNIVYNCSATAYNTARAKENIVRNNIFGLSGDGAVQVASEESYNEGIKNLTLERNILVSDFAAIYFSKYTWFTMTDDSNLMWDYTFGENVLSIQQDFETYPEGMLNAAKKTNFDKLKSNGYYNNAVVADPLFADPFNGDFTLPENSPAWDIGFEPIDISDVGPRK